MPFRTSKKPKGCRSTIQWARDHTSCDALTNERDDKVWRGGKKKSPLFFKLSRTTWTSFSELFWPIISCSTHLHKTWMKTTVCAPVFVNFLNPCPVFTDIHFYDGRRNQGESPFRLPQCSTHHAHPGDNHAKSFELNIQGLFFIGIHCII